MKTKNSSNYWERRKKHEKRFPNSYEYKSSSPKCTKKNEKTMPKKTYINERNQPLSKSAIKGVKAMEREKKKHDYRIAILKKQISTEKKKLKELKKKLKTLE